MQSAEANDDRGVTRHKGLPFLQCILPFSSFHLDSIHRSSSEMRVLAIFLLALGAVQAADPKVAVTRLKNLPSKLFYFEDTSVRVLPLEQGSLANL